MLKAKIEQLESLKPYSKVQVECGKVYEEAQKHSTVGVSIIKNMGMMKYRDQVGVVFIEIIITIFPAKNGYSGRGSEKIRKAAWVGCCWDWFGNGQQPIFTEFGKAGIYVEGNKRKGGLYLTIKLTRIFLPKKSAKN